jgi:methylase of polypeptide subunit release factors
MPMERTSITVGTVNPADYAAVHSFQCEYLDQEDFGAFSARMQACPEMYLAAFHGEKLVGICYGQPWWKNQKVLQLQGIAVNLDETLGYARKGIGSWMLREIENIARTKRFSIVEVGSADDGKVEQFYLRNGYKPFELVAKGPSGKEYERVSVTNYETAKLIQTELRGKHDAREVIFIFGKTME